MVPRAAGLLLLVLLPLAAAGRSLNQDAAWTYEGVEGMFPQCNNSQTNFGEDPVGALTIDECQACLLYVTGVVTLPPSALPSITAASENTAQSWLCYGLCQNTSVWQYDNVGTTAKDQCVQCISTKPALACQMCFENVPSRWTGLAGNLPGDTPNAALVTEARSWCLECAVEPFTYADPSQLNAYTVACAACANIPDGREERNWCFACIKELYAQFEPLGIKSKWETEERFNDWGACAAKANETYWVNTGVVAAGGIFTMCAQDDFTAPPYVYTTPVLSTAGCKQCMQAALNETAQPANSSKAYACATACRNPNYAPDVGVESVTVAFEELADACVSCVADPNVVDAWGCKNCLQQNFEAGYGVTSFFEPAVCLTCVAGNPFKGKISAYDWACGECAMVEEETLRNLCLDCIMSSATAASAGDGIDALLADEVQVSDAATRVCLCIDMIKASTWSQGGKSYNDWFTAACPDCNALERTCYKKRNITVPVNFTDDLPTFMEQYAGTWGLIHVDDSTGINGTVDPTTLGIKCHDCMVAFEDAGKNAASCEQYCMNPYTMSSAEQVASCFTCLDTKSVLGAAYGGGDVSGCESCIQMTDDNDKREACMGCLYLTTKWPDTRDWACMECSKFTAQASIDTCLLCLSNNVLDPCDCVDGTTRGWLNYAAQGLCLNQATLSMMVVNQTAIADPDAASTLVECAKAAGKSLFGLMNSECYTFTANVPFVTDFITDVGETTCSEGADCMCLNGPQLPV
ncbi:hypothetical protein FOA52_000155 [Chlamydomonas sp. UWO 241]|nr:hypothetical protein FOA52_000155 [Chlamydomonas sp. UWO 241]